MVFTLAAIYVMYGDTNCSGAHRNGSSQKQDRTGSDRIGSDRIGLTKPGLDRTGLTKPELDCVRLTKSGPDQKKNWIAINFHQNSHVTYKLLFLGHRNLIKKITQTAVINIVFKRIFYRT